MANSSTAADDLSPPPPVAVDGGFNYQTTTTTASVVASSKITTSSSAAENLSPSILVTVLILATAVIVSASLYLLLRLISRHCNRRRPRTDAVDSLRMLNHHNNNRHSGGGISRRVSPEEIGGGTGSVVDSLPIFTFSSIHRTGNRSNGGGENGDCAVCLSKFEPEDQLRLLPLCCHAFHSACIDAWISANQTCPLCRSPIFVSESEILRKINMTSSSGGNQSGSFRIELGSISRRRIEDLNNNRRSYSIGSFDYIVDDSLSEITVESSSLRPMTDLAGTEKEDSAARNVAAEVGGGGGRNWLREYAERLTSSFSLSSSFRSSGRFFTGSSRRNELNALRNSDLEASRLGDEIGEMFRWLSPSGE
ncbi:hypothetical protein Droror1_Dr00011387 [Drosera rotundifolia]